MSFTISSFFSGAGGLDLGFSKAGFNVQYANEFDKNIWATFEHNHPHTKLDRRSIVDIPAHEVPDCDGIIGGPPCQSWSEAGTRKGINDKRGQLFFDFIRILEDKKPKFFLAENVSGMLAPRHKEALDGIKKTFEDAGYDLFFKLLNAADYGVAQDRKRVIFIGFRKDLNVNYTFPEPLEKKLVLKDIIKDLEPYAKPAINKSKPNPDLEILNHEYMTGGHSSMFMSRNRVRTWEQPSFTIQAGGRHAPIHPGAPVMEKVDKNKFIFKTGHEEKYRRLSVRECARIQSFPDDFEFIYKDVNTGYKMIGNAVAVDFAKVLGESIFKHLQSHYQSHNKGQQMNVVKAIINIANNHKTHIKEAYNGSNKMNNMGDALEKYVEDAFSGNFEVSDAIIRAENIEKAFSYLGNSSNPPDLMLRGGAAIEVKKVETLKPSLPLNSSHPKNKLYKTDSRITEECKGCEDWSEKDFIYITGFVKKDILKHISIIDSSCYSAEKEVYEKVFQDVKDGLNNIEHLDFTETNELGRINNIDVLGLTHLRIRGMWILDHPLVAFSPYISDVKAENIRLTAIITLVKYNNLPIEDRDELNKHDQISVKQIRVPNPNNRANFIPSILIEVCG